MPRNKPENALKRLQAWHDFGVRVIGLGTSGVLALAGVDPSVTLTIACVSIAGPQAVKFVADKIRSQ